MDYKRMWTALKRCSETVFDADCRKDVFLVIAVIEEVEDLLSDIEASESLMD